MSKQTSYYSEIRIFSEDSKKFIEKSYPLPFLSRAQIEDLRQRMFLQREAFEELHIPTSELLEMDIVKFDGGFKILVLERFEGLDFVDIVDGDNFGMYLERMLNNIYKPLLRSTVDPLLRSGIDTSIRNCVYRMQKGEFCYVDFMPPKVFYKGHYTQEVPEIKRPFYDIRMFSHNDRAGVVYALYINLARLYPTKRKFVVSKLEQFLNEIGEPQLMEHIASSPFYRLSNPKSAVQTVADLSDWKGIKYLQLREAAIIAAEKDKEFREVLEDFFKLTHHETDVNSKEYGLLPAKRFEKAKSTLVKILKK